MRIVLAAAAAAALCGCAQTHAFVSAKAMHASHLTQHFDSPATNYGYDALAVSIRIERARSGPFAEFSEGYILERRWDRSGLRGAGAMLGPSELTQLTVGYRWRVW